MSHIPAGHCSSTQTNAASDFLLSHSPLFLTNWARNLTFHLQSSSQPHGCQPQRCGTRKDWSCIAIPDTAPAPKPRRQTKLLALSLSKFNAIFIFVEYLAVQDSSIGDIVIQSVSQTFDFHTKHHSGSIKRCENEYPRCGWGGITAGGGIVCHVSIQKKECEILEN